MAAHPYVQQAWADADVSKPLSAARMTNIEDGIRDSQQQPAVRVFHNTTQSATNGAELVMAFNSERFDQAFGSASTQHDNVTNNSRLTALYAGVYSIVGNIEFAGNPVTAQFRIKLNATTYIAYSYAAANVQRMNIATIYQLAVNDFVELTVVQSSGGAMNINSTGNYSPEFMMVRVG